MPEPAGSTNTVAPLLLASTSPRRRAILEQLGVPFDVVAPAYEEKPLAGHGARESILAHASGKATSIRSAHPNRLILGVDTGVVLDDVLFGKPSDAGDAARILGDLAGRTHAVVSGLCLLDGAVEVAELVETAVTFRVLSDQQIERYVSSGEWRGLAGGYAIQGSGALLIERVEGDYLNVVGLPARLLVDTLLERQPELLAIGV